MERMTLAFWVKSAWLHRPRTATHCTQDAGGFCPPKNWLKRSRCSVFSRCRIHQTFDGWRHQTWAAPAAKLSLWSFVDRGSIERWDWWDGQSSVWQRWCGVRWSLLNLLSWHTCENNSRILHEFAVRWIHEKLWTCLSLSNILDEFQYQSWGDAVKVIVDSCQGTVVPIFVASVRVNTSILECGSVWNTGNFRASLCHWNILEYQIVPFRMITIWIAYRFTEIRHSISFGIM